MFGLLVGVHCLHVSTGTCIPIHKLTLLFNYYVCCNANLINMRTQIDFYWHLRRAAHYCIKSVLMKVSPYTISGRTFNVRLEKAEYNNSAICLQLLNDGGDEDGLPFAVCTVYIPHEQLDEDEVAVKDYSENEGMLQYLIKNKVVKLPHRYAKTGYVTVPICRILI
jgi:hypothetical protein